MARPLTAAQTAHEIGKSADWFYRHRRALEGLGLTPIPNLATARPMYDPEVVRRYKLGVRPAAPVPADNDNVADGRDRDNDETMEQRLARRAELVAKG